MAFLSSLSKPLSAVFMIICCVISVAALFYASQSVLLFTKFVSSQALDIDSVEILSAQRQNLEDDRYSKYYYCYCAAYITVCDMLFVKVVLQILIKMKIKFLSNNNNRNVFKFT